MSGHAHTCPHCGAGWNCSAGGCEAPAAFPCPSCFRVEMERLAERELARIETHAQAPVWFAAAAALVVLAAVCF